MAVLSLYHTYTTRDVSRSFFKYAVEFLGAPHTLEGTTGNMGTILVMTRSCYIRLMDIGREQSQNLLECATNVRLTL